jgi:hypothetical protein
MMELWNLWKGDDLAYFGAFDRSGRRIVLTQGQVSVGAVVGGLHHRYERLAA